MPRSAQTGPVPPSLLARRGSLPHNDQLLSSSVASAAAGTGTAAGFRVGPLASSPLFRSNSLDVVGRSLNYGEPPSFDAEPGPMEANTTLLSHRTTAATAGNTLQPALGVPSRLGSPIGRPVLQQRRDAPSTWTSTSPGSGLSTSAPTSSSYFPPVQPSTANGGPPPPLTPDSSPTVVLSRASPLKSVVGSRTSELAAPSLTNSLYYGQARSSGAYPFPIVGQTGTATPPTTPATSTRPLLKLPTRLTVKSPSQVPATSPSGCVGQLSPHLLDDHVLNPLFNARYELRSSLGSGGYGFVCIALDRLEACEVAVKFILRAKVPAHSWVAYGDHGTEGDGMPAKGGKVPMESELLLRVKHWGVVAGLACFADPKFFYLVRLVCACMVQSVSLAV